MSIFVSKRAYFKRENGFFTFGLSFFGGARVAHLDGGFVPGKKDSQHHVYGAGAHRFYLKRDQGLSQSTRAIKAAQGIPKSLITYLPDGQG